MKVESMKTYESSRLRFIYANFHKGQIIKIAHHCVEKLFSGVYHGVYK